MKILLSLTLALSIVSLSQAETRPDPNDLTFETWEVATPPEAIREIERRMGLLPVENPLFAFDGITEIINLGQAIWKVVEAGKPVLTSKNAYASALPANVKSAGELENFSPLQFKSYTKRATSWYYGTAFEITYTLAHKYHGSFEGKGQYLDAVTVLPHKVDVSWAYNLNVGVEKISVSNLASKESPVGCLVMEFAMTVTSWFRTTQYKNLYEFRGDSPNVRAID